MRLDADAKEKLGRKLEGKRLAGELIPADERARHAAQKRIALGHGRKDEKTGRTRATGDRTTKGEAVN